MIKKSPPEFQSRILHTIILVTPLFKFKTISKQRFFSKGITAKKFINHIFYAILLDNLGYSMFKLNEMDGIPDLFFMSP
jgi:hypothetical protein